MKRLRSKSVDLTVTCMTKLGGTFLCGNQVPTPSPSSFYSKSTDCWSYSKTQSQVTPGGTLQKFCNSLKKPFQESLTVVRKNSKKCLGFSKSNDDTVLFTATAIRDNVPHPYDCHGLPFRKGDRIEVLHISDYGVWTGRLGDKIGNFKFVDVEKDQVGVMRSDKSQSYPELQNVCLRSKSVSDLLSSINLENLIPKFILNGYDTTESVKHMTDDDLDYLGIEDDKTKDLIMGTVDWLKLCGDSAPANDDCLRIPDSGYNSSQDSFHSYQNHQSLSYQHPVKGLSQSVTNLLIMTPL